MDKTTATAIATVLGEELTPIHEQLASLRKRVDVMGLPDEIAKRLSSLAASVEAESLRRADSAKDVVLEFLDSLSSKGVTVISAAHGSVFNVED